MDTTRAGVDATGQDPHPGLTVLAEAGRVLGVSLDYRRTLQALSEVGLGVFGDACLVALMDHVGRLRIVAAAHVDGSKRRIVEALWNAPITHCSHTAAVVGGGRSRLLPAIDQRLPAGLEDDALALVGQLNLGPTMIVPLIVRRQRIGALIFSKSAGDRAYDAADVTLPEELARRAAAAIDNARAFSHTSDVARTLQERLLPPRLPRIAGIELAARYQPADQHVDVGGDFYDAFPLGEDRWGLLIGDVAGKGPAAAATTAVVRYTARAAARFGSRLDVAAAVNDALLEMEDGDGFCTMTYAELQLGPGRVVLAIINCGHPAPLLVGPNGDIRELHCQGSLLGQFPDVEVGSLTVKLRPGETVVFVTDGVLEARAPRREADHRTVELFDHEGLASTLAAGAGESAARVACRIQQAALAFSGGSLQDDLATLVLRVVGPPRPRAHTSGRSSTFRRNASASAISASAVGSGVPRRR